MWTAAAGKAAIRPDVEDQVIEVSGLTAHMQHSTDHPTDDRRNAWVVGRGRELIRPRWRY